MKTVRVRIDPAGLASGRIDPYDMSLRQILFAKYLLGGHPGTKAAEMAGFEHCYF